MSDTLDPEVAADLRERYATEAISQPELAAEFGLSNTQVNRAIDAGWDWVAVDRVDVAGDATVLKYSNGHDRFHLPTADGDPLCGETRSKFWEKERAVLPWFECCEKCARHVVVRGPGVTTAAVTVHGGEEA